MQLEEFEKAVKLSHGDNSSDENAITRHRQFVSAIGNQISRVEKGLNDSLIEEGKPPLCWVQLDKEERDDLANFLSGVSRDSHEAKYVAHGNPDLMKSFTGTVTVNKDKRYVVEVAAKEPSEEKDDSLLVAPQQPYGQTRVLSSPDIGAWKIVIADEDTDKRSAEVRPDMLNHESGQTGSLRSVESTSKLQWFRNNLWKAKNEEPHFLRHGLSYYLDLKGVTRFAQVDSIFIHAFCSFHTNTSLQTLQIYSLYLPWHLGICFSAVVIILTVKTLFYHASFSSSGSENAISGYLYLVTWMLIDKSLKCKFPVFAVLVFKMNPKLAFLLVQSFFIMFQ